jgi:transposase
VPFHQRHAEAIRTAVAARPGRTLVELRRHLGVRVHLATLWKALRALGRSWEKKSARAAEQDRPDVAARRAEWRRQQPTLDPDRLVFLDETGASPRMPCGYGWGPTDRRVIDFAPRGHGKTLTFVAASRTDGRFAPTAIDGAMSGATFAAYVRPQRVRGLRPGAVAVRDNLPARKVAGIREAIRAAGAEVRSLPPYRPDLNPIEMVLADLKAEWRRREERTIPALEAAFGESLDWFPRRECRNDFRHCGYTLRR